MKPAEYLDAVKARLSVTSDYELAKRLGMKTGHLCMVRNSERPMPLDVAFKIAITLELDPAEVVADLESQREKNEERRAFWRGFISHAQRAAAVVLCMLALHCSGIYAGAAAPLGGFRRVPNRA